MKDRDTQATIPAPSVCGHYPALARRPASAECIAVTLPQALAHPQLASLYHSPISYGQTAVHHSISIAFAEQVLFPCHTSFFR